jgi:4-hydroxy-tetrahydrodipicolinate reductase
MKLALIGYGAMGQLVEQQAEAAGDQIGIKITSNESDQDVDELAAMLRRHDVAIDFSTGPIVLKNVEACALAGVPLVEGTTGWKDQENRAKEIMTEHDGALVYGANFSIGVNVFYRIVRNAAELFAGLDQYEAFIEEQHHSRKRDAPSGTALQLKNVLAEFIKAEISIASTRAGDIPGTHRVGFDSAADQITLTHTARSRAGFAAGALLAARWINGRKGVYEFSEAIDEILSSSASTA